MDSAQEGNNLGFEHIEKPPPTGVVSSTTGDVDNMMMGDEEGMRHVSPETTLLPTFGDALPTSGDALPTSGDPLPTSGDTLPASGDALPTSGDALPTFGDALPSSGDALPTSGDVLLPSTELITEDLLNFSSTESSKADTAIITPVAPLPPPPSAPAIDSFFEPDSPLMEKQSKKPADDKSDSSALASESGDVQMTCCSGSSSPCCAWLKNIDPRVLDLVYWRCVKKSGVVFGSTMITLLALAFFSFVSVLAYLALAVMAVTLSFRVYKNIIGAVQKSSEGHPFKTYLEMDVSLPEDRVHHVVDVVLQHAAARIKAVRRLFLIEDLVDSIKFVLLLWVCTYIGAWFNGLTLIILSVLIIFSVPKIYETHKTQIDSYMELAIGQVKKVVAQVQSKIPLPGKKKQQ